MPAGALPTVEYVNGSCAICADVEPATAAASEGSSAATTPPTSSVTSLDASSVPSTSQTRTRATVGSLKTSACTCTAYSFGTNVIVPARASIVAASVIVVFA